MRDGCCGILTLRKASCKASAGKVGFSFHNAVRNRAGRSTSLREARSGVSSPGAISGPCSTEYRNSPSQVSAASSTVDSVKDCMAFGGEIIGHASFDNAYKLVPVL